MASEVYHNTVRVEYQTFKLTIPQSRQTIMKLGYEYKARVATEHYDYRFKIAVSHLTSSFTLHGWMNESMVGEWYHNPTRFRTTLVQCI